MWTVCCVILKTLNELNEKDFSVWPLNINAIANVKEIHTNTAYLLDVQPGYQVAELS